jgi:hypothetical protein
MSIRIPLLSYSQFRKTESANGDGESVSRGKILYGSSGWSLSVRRRRIHHREHREQRGKIGRRISLLGKS